MTTATDVRLKARYREEIVPALQEEFKFKNIMHRKGAADAVAAVVRDRANEALDAVTTSEAMRRALPVE